MGELHNAVYILHINNIDIYSYIKVTCADYKHDHITCYGQEHSLSLYGIYNNIQKAP